jgi:hypothetical protein
MCSIIPRWLCASIYLVFWIISCSQAKKLVKHDASFVPDVVLRVTIDTIKLNCQPRLSTLINGQYPAPPIYLKAEQTTWIRVYNDADMNTTMVCSRVIAGRLNQESC